MTATRDFSLDATYRKALLDRFLRYVKVNTRSAEDSKTSPSSACQWDLLRLLEVELKELGLKDASLDEHGYLFATLPSNLPAGRSAPTVGYLAHVDTYPGTPGENVKPQVVEKYAGGDLKLPGTGELIAAANNPLLARCVGHTLVHTDGTTLLGADDKAGIAAIMTVLDWLIHHPEVPHAALRVGFTPDEEIGQGTLHFDVARFGAKAAYTFDGSVLGEIEDETFCADSALATLTGFDCHPGTAKGVMVSAIRAAAYLVNLLPRDHVPETTAGRESFLHPVAIGGEVGKATVRFIVRGFTEQALEERENDLRRIARETESAFPGLKVDVEFKPTYRNMKVVLDKHPEVVSLAMEACRRAGVEPELASIRGGTDGSALCFKGLPTPNVWAGGVNFHGVKEWVSLEWMAKSVETGLHLAVLWGEQKA